MGITINAGPGNTIIAVPISNIVNPITPMINILTCLRILRTIVVMDLFYPISIIYILPGKQTGNKTFCGFVNASRRKSSTKNALRKGGRSSDPPFLRNARP
jgi:hypothetical protein